MDTILPPHASRTDNAETAAIRIECLGCGTLREVVPADRGPVHAGECRRCGDVGWAYSRDAA